MGRKPTRKGKHIYLSIAGLILFSFWGCTAVEKTTVQVEVSNASPETTEMTNAGAPGFKAEERGRTNVADPAVAKEQEQAEDREVQEHLLRGQDLFIQGDYEGSLKEYKKVLSLSPNHPPGDVALFNVGLIYAHPKNPRRDPAMSLGVFQRLIKDYPKSPRAEQAKIWVEVIQENETLKQLIEKSKQVDLDIEEMKRERAK